MREVDWTVCESMSDEPELLRINEVVKQKYEEEGRDLRILEIGCYLGRSTSMLSQWGSVLTIDLFTNIDIGLQSYNDIGQLHFTPYIKNMLQLQLIERVHTTVSTSSFLDMLTPQNFDVAFIDADHHYEEVNKDIIRTERHLGPKSIMILHDYARPGFGFPPFNPEHPHHGPVDPWSGVKRAADEMIARGEWEPMEHYLGVLFLCRKSS